MDLEKSSSGILQKDPSSISSVCRSKSMERSRKKCQMRHLSLWEREEQRVCEGYRNALVRGLKGFLWGGCVKSYRNQGGGKKIAAKNRFSCGKSCGGA